MPRRMFRVPRRPHPLKRALGVATMIAGAMLLSTGAAAAEFVAQRPAAEAPRALSAFDVNGARVTLVAYGRGAYADAEMHARCREARNMRKAVPGYPVESQFNVGLRMAF